jgi:aspartate carbamoyltransferase catalytic subunit
LDSQTTVVLDRDDIRRTLVRIAHEIVEKNPDRAVALVGIHRRGAHLARRLQPLTSELLDSAVPLGSVDIAFYRDDLNRLAGGGRAAGSEFPVVHSTELDFSVDARTIVIVDDVLYTGRTVRAAIDVIFDYGRPAKIQLAALVDRGHRETMNDNRIRHLISIDDLDRAGIERILDRAESFAEVSGREIKKVPALRGRTIVNLFYEASTRTSSSFELAAKRLSADVVNIRSAGSSVDKGESLKDTVQTLSAYDPAAIVIRSPHAGAAQLVAGWTSAAVVNAGDGKHEHPTQALLDVFTLRRRLGSLEGVNIWIVGDVAHSRVARSNILAFTRMGARVTVAGPPTLIPRDIEALGCDATATLERLAEAEVVYVLRMQHERMSQSFVPSLREYAARYQINDRRLSPGQLVMHPGPVNRGVELSAATIDSPQALIGEQVKAGVAVRMAVLYELLVGSPSLAAVA